MIGTLDALFAATVLFVGGHFLLSNATLRQPLNKWLGAQGFLVIYVLAVSGALLWLIMAYDAAPVRHVWAPPPETNWIPIVILPFASILAVAGLTTRSPTLVGGEQARSGLDDPVPGILRITRHPFLCGAALWAGAHLACNGDLASIIVFTGILILSIGGMWHIDQKRAQRLGAVWGPIALTTSCVPFAAILSGRTCMDWVGIGIVRPLAGLALYAALFYLHPWLFGVMILPS